MRREAPRPVADRYSSGLPVALLCADHIRTLVDPCTGHSIEYWTYEDDDGDCRKLWHFLWDKDADTLVEPDFTPYQIMHLDDLHTYLSLGCPKRIGLGPLHSEDLVQLVAAETHVAAE